MARTNSFTIKASLTTLLFLISLICFYISYSDFMKIKDEETIIYDEMDINYFDKKKFQKYYEIISIESLNDPILNKEKSYSYFENIAILTTQHIRLITLIMAIIITITSPGVFNTNVL